MHDAVGFLSLAPRYVGERDEPVETFVECSTTSQLLPGTHSYETSFLFADGIGALPGRRPRETCSSRFGSHAGRALHARKRVGRPPKVAILGGHRHQLPRRPAQPRSKSAGSSHFHTSSFSARLGLSLFDPWDRHPGDGRSMPWCERWTLPPPSIHALLDEPSPSAPSPGLTSRQRTRHCARRAWRGSRPTAQLATTAPGTIAQRSRALLVPGKNDRRRRPAHRTVHGLDVALPSRT